MKIRIISVGKVQDAWLKKGIEHYSKQVLRFAKLEWVELSDYPDRLPLERVKALEGEAMLAKLSPQEFVIALDLAGEVLDSLSFSARLQKGLELGGAKLTFLIAGSNGYDEAVLKRANWRWSLGKLTYPHQMVKLLLMEQLFRAFKIARGETYHK